MKSMRNIVAVLVLFSITGATTARADSKGITVTNNTSYTMTEFYASPTSASAFDTSTNLYSGKSLAPGQQATINISDGSENCQYDLMAVLYGATQYAYSYSVNSCTGNANWSINGN